ncbi:uncharacterized protein EI97DRAFT_454251 [Westerdykella ornata]|uniref:BTB domain-containing protein n=1 Tax=Westerdykella ornata TaxID=318751 RepID=A0A6A6JWN4_WESOR|nr:uncharacterized protein EI97DRAFT_454251 [Westerdykella ornata]KAF2281030.1 hypothetical protein EI97DRAFT_454251 [Westerdykella ornata]
MDALLKLYRNDSVPTSLPPCLRLDNSTKHDLSDDESVHLKILLEHAFGSDRRVQPPITKPDGLCVQHVYRIFKRRLGCDTMITVTCTGPDGSQLSFEWDVHQVFLQAGSRVLDEHLNPGGITNQSPPNQIALNYHPMMVDRLVTFFYTQTYQLDEGGLANRFHCISKAPEGYDPLSFAMKGIPYLGFHVAMYRMGEELEYPELMDIAFSKMVEQIIFKRRSTTRDLMEMVDLVYNLKFCNDKDNRLAALVVAAVVLYERKVWTQAQLIEFEEGVRAVSRFMVDWDNTVNRHRQILEREQTMGPKRKTRRTSNGHDRQ